MSFSIPIIIEENQSIERIHEPVTFGIPFPQGVLKNESQLELKDSSGEPLPLQTQAISKWIDNSIKWLLIDTQISIPPNETKEIVLSTSNAAQDHKHRSYESIKVTEQQHDILVATGVAQFLVNKNIFKPFDRVIIAEQEILDTAKTQVILKDDQDQDLEPVIKNIGIETQGNVRTTLKIVGNFLNNKKQFYANFFARIHFYAGQSLIRIDFTIRNPMAAKHPGGLWDLGDPGSIYFNDLSFYFGLGSERDALISWTTNPKSHIKSSNSRDFRIYQDSSGGENWQSANHVNRNAEVKTSFRGYRIYADGNIIEAADRAAPTMVMKGKDSWIAAGIRYFWQNFPKSLEVKNDILIARLFPLHFNDLFELQGGEQKTHTIFLDFGLGNECENRLHWIDFPLIPHATPEWYSNADAVHYLIPEKEDNKNELIALINAAIQGDNTFFHRREIIDEYGWRNFGEFYADHEAVGHQGEHPLVSHYNNQYDGIWGCLMQFLCSGNPNWFILADQLCMHVKDIDIYHTDQDRIEYNCGLFWHTEHYIDAATATHRCFSKQHLSQRDKAHYGGGPSPSHNYGSGLVLHYFLTGEPSSMEAAKELAQFIVNNLDHEQSVVFRLKKHLKSVRNRLTNLEQKNERVQVNKVYGFDGPGRASGNALTTLLDAFVLTGDAFYLTKAECLIKQCIHPDDDIEKRDLLDTENRWMYTVFLQALGKYLVIKTDQNQHDEKYHYARDVLLHYAQWMVQNEYPYLDKPEKLEFPNETWAAQDIRKCNILLYASQFSDQRSKEKFIQKAQYFYQQSITEMMKFDTKILTRPITLMMLNSLIPGHFLNTIHTIDDHIFKISKELFPPINQPLMNQFQEDHSS